MENPNENSVFLYASVDQEDLVKYKRHLKDSIKLIDENLELAVFSKIQEEGTFSAVGYLVDLYRKFKLCKNDREIVLNQEDQTIALQLCLAEINREKLGDFDVEASTVIHTKKLLTEDNFSTGNSDSDLQEIKEKYRKYKKMCNLVDIQDVLSKVTSETNTNEEMKEKLNNTSFLVPENLLYSTHLTERSIINNIIIQNKPVYKVTAEVPLEPTDEISLFYEKFSLGLPERSSNFENFSTPTFTPRTPKQTNVSVSEKYIEKIFLSYLQMMVNSRCEISLARVINVPDRGLDHKAFTDIKHEAAKKNMPMFQLIVSHIMRIRLGGKSYAPDPNSALMKHVKGLGELTDLVHKLQSVMEDPNSKAAVCRLINMIKNTIMKHRDNTLRQEAIVAVADRLKKQAEECLTKVEIGPISPQKSVASGGSVVGRNTLKTVQQILDTQAASLQQMTSVEYLSDMVSSQRTPQRFPSVLTTFRSPVEFSPDEKVAPLAERLKNKMKKPKHSAGQKRFQSYMDWAAPVENANCNTNVVDVVQITDFTNCQTIAHPAPKPQLSAKAKKVLESINDQENAVTDPISSSQPIQNNKSKITKRKGESLEKTAPNSKKTKTTNKTKATNKTKTKQPTLTSGQKQLTAFFRL